MAKNQQEVDNYARHFEEQAARWRYYDDYADEEEEEEEDGVGDDPALSPGFEAFRPPECLPGVGPGAQV